MSVMTRLSSLLAADISNKGPHSATPNWEVPLPFSTGSPLSEEGDLAVADLSH